MFHDWLAERAVELSEITPELVESFSKGPRGRAVSEKTAAPYRQQVVRVCLMCLMSRAYRLHR